MTGGYCKVPENLAENSSNIHNQTMQNPIYFPSNYSCINSISGSHGQLHILYLGFSLDNLTARLFLINLNLTFRKLLVAPLLRIARDSISFAIAGAPVSWWSRRRGGDGMITRVIGAITTGKTVENALERIPKFAPKIKKVGARAIVSR